MVTNGGVGGKVWLVFRALFETNVLELNVCVVIIIVSDSLNFVCNHLLVRVP